MDAALLTAFLAPFLPFLMKLGTTVAEKAAESAAGQFGKDAWEKAKAVWSKLHPKVEPVEGAKVAVNKLADKPESEVWKAALQEELETLLKNDSALSSEIAQILDEKIATQVASTQIQQTVTNNQGQVIGQMQNSQAKSIGTIGSVQGDIQL
jgi:hypothetical protein